MEVTGAKIVLLIYIVLLIAGGLVGFLKAKSKASLIMSTAFAVALALTEFVIPGATFVSDVLLAALLVFFGMRLAKSKKLMPAGMMTAVTLLTLVLRFVV